jgi:hypothetical protein
MLYRTREVVECRIERRVGSGLTVDLLELLIEIGPQVGVSPAGSFRTQLLLNELVEQASDRRNVDAGASVAGRRRNLDCRLRDITGRLRIGDVAGDDRQTRLRRV